MSDLTAALKSLYDARDAQCEAEDFYEGNAPEVIDSPRLRKLLGGRTPYRFNYAKSAVTSRLSRLQVLSVTSPDAHQAELLSALWKRNQLKFEIRDATEGTLTLGSGYVMVLPMSEDPEDVGIWFNSAKQVRAFYDEENPREIRYVVKVWKQSDSRTRVTLFYRDRTERYVSRVPLGPGVPEDRDFIEWTAEEGDLWPEANDTGVLPVFHLRNGKGYGRPEHKDAFGPQNAINKLVATQMAAVDYQGLPQRYALEDTSLSGGVAAVDEDFDDEVTDGTERDTPQLKAEPGSVWWLRGVKDVGQFDVAPADVFLDPMREYVNAMSITTDTPLHAFKVDGQMPSGESRRAAEIPLVKRVNDLKEMLESTWIEVFSHALRLMGVEDPQIQIQWAPAETYDDADSWDTAKTELEVGVPLRMVLAKRGYSDEEMDAMGVPDLPGSAA